MSKSFISKRANMVGRTKIRMMYEMEKQYPNVISFTVGEPDFPTPENIVAACKASLDAHQTGYAPNQGLLELRKAVSRRVQKTHGINYDPSEILITAGGILQTIATMLATTSSKAHEVKVSGLPQNRIREAFSARNDCWAAYQAFLAVQEKRKHRRLISKRHLQGEP